MPVFWSGSTVVGTSGGTDTSGNPINPQGIVGGVDYGGGVGASAPSGSQPVPGKKGVYTYTDSQGNVHYVEDYSSQGGGKYDTILSGPALLTSHSGSGFERQRAALLNDPSLRVAISSNPQIGSAYEQHGLLSYEVDGRQFKTQKEADKYATYLNQQRETEVKRPSWQLPILESGVVRKPFLKSPESLTPPQVREKSYLEKLDEYVSQRFGLPDWVRRVESGYQIDKKELQKLAAESNKTKTPMPEWFTGSKKEFNAYLKEVAEGTAEKPVTALKDVGVMAATSYIGGAVFGAGSALTKAGLSGLSAKLLPNTNKAASIMGGGC